MGCGNFDCGIGFDVLNRFDMRWLSVMGNCGTNSRREYDVVVNHFRGAKIPFIFQPCISGKQLLKVQRRAYLDKARKTKPMK